MPPPDKHRAVVPAAFSCPQDPLLVVRLRFRGAARCQRFLVQIVLAQNLQLGMQNLSERHCLRHK